MWVGQSQGQRLEAGQAPEQDLKALLGGADQIVLLALLRRRSRMIRIVVVFAFVDRFLAPQEEKGRQIKVELYQGIWDALGQVGKGQERIEGRSQPQPHYGGRDS